MLIKKKNAYLWILANYLQKNYSLFHYIYLKSLFELNNLTTYIFFMCVVFKKHKTVK